MASPVVSPVTPICILSLLLVAIVVALSSPAIAGTDAAVHDGRPTPEARADLGLWHRAPNRMAPAAAHRLPASPATIA